MKREVWKAVLGYEGLYEISNYGNVKALNYKCLGIVKIIRQSTSCYGYKVVGLSKNGKTKQFFVHRLVAIAFVPNPYGYPIVNHKDENRTNNNAENLEWCTNKYNLNYGSARERMVRSKRKRVLQYDLNCNLIKVFRSISEAARETGLCRAHISACYRGENRTHGGFFWRPDGYPPKPGDKVLVFDGYEIKQVCIEGIEPSLNGKAYVAFGGFSGRLRLADPLLCFPTREALCEHYRKIFE